MGSIARMDTKPPSRCPGHRPRPIAQNLLLIKSERPEPPPERRKKAKLSGQLLVI